MPIDYTKYPENWKSEIVPRILGRAENRCESCGVNNEAELWSVPLKIREAGEYKVKKIWVSDDSDMRRLVSTVVNSTDCKIKRIKVILTVAHLDHDELNHDVRDDRLMAMCQSCHLAYDAKEKYRRAIAKSEAAA